VVVLAIDQLGFIRLSDEVCSDFTYIDTSAMGLTGGS
jgi:hypothetical protein